jgi:hypothetical protein
MMGTGMIGGEHWKRNDGERNDMVGSDWKRNDGEGIDGRVLMGRGIIVWD